MPRYTVRNRDELRQRMSTPKRIIPHSTRSLGALVGVSHATIGHLLTGKQETVDEGLAQRLAVAFGCRVDDLFVSDVSTIVDVDGKAPEGDSSE